MIESSAMDAPVLLRSKSLLYWLIVPQVNQLFLIQSSRSSQVSRCFMFLSPLAIEVAALSFTSILYHYSVIMSTVFIYFFVFFLTFSENFFRNG